MNPTEPAFKDIVLSIAAKLPEKAAIQFLSFESKEEKDLLCDLYPMLRHFNPINPFLNIRGLMDNDDNLLSIPKDDRIDAIEICIGIILMDKIISERFSHNDSEWSRVSPLGRNYDRLESIMFKFKLKNYKSSYPELLEIIREILFNEKA